MWSIYISQYTLKLIFEKCDVVNMETGLKIASHTIADSLIFPAVSNFQYEGNKTILCLFLSQTTNDKNA